ncbi:hypothetical protein NDU88_000762 [Pleurodeles waltl]|uniref:Uncharacterized protein n=1 Tax=Pleurodeles waltl TaxID=8319 RepID=A0AAV7VV14_PLEWA|nr:hypothetical protein NDU88_000762 [Pleurodeles waltl]
MEPDARQPNPKVKASGPETERLVTGCSAGAQAKSALYQPDGSGWLGFAVRVSPGLVVALVRPRGRGFQASSSCQAEQALGKAVVRACRLDGVPDA